MKKYILFIFLLMQSTLFFTQTGNIGVLTTNPRTNLDVNGTTNINNEINLGGTNSVVGNSGTVGDLVSANGVANPVWKKFDLPNGYLDGLVLTASYLKSDIVGKSFPSNNGAAGVPYTADQSPAGWETIDGVSEATFPIRKLTNVVTVFVQTVAQITTTGTGNISASYGCGIYIDDKLKFTRTGIVTGASGSYKMLTLNASISNLTVGTHSYKFACAGRNIPTGVTLTIGQAQTTVSTALSPTMAGTSSSLKILEPI